MLQARCCVIAFHEEKISYVLERNYHFQNGKTFNLFFGHCVCTDIYRRTDFEPKSITLEELNIERSSLMLWNQH